MTYRELLHELNHLTVLQLDSDVTVYDLVMDEFFPVSTLDFAYFNGILDAGHPYFTIQQKLEEKRKVI